MQQTGNCHFVTIRTNRNATESFLETKDELMENICDQQSLSRDHILISTICYEKHLDDFDVNKSKILDLSVCEVAERIIKGIQSEKDFFQISGKRNFFEFIFKVFCNRIHFFNFNIFHKNCN